MPTYTYQCADCGHSYDAFHAMKDAAHTVCPACGGKVQRLIGAGAGIVFKGSGFYVTDYRSGGKGSDSSGSEGGQGGEKGARRRPGHNFHDQKRSARSKIHGIERWRVVLRFLIGPAFRETALVRAEAIRQTGPGVLGILAGSGDLPWVAARNAVRAGEDVRVFYYTGEIPPADLASIAIPVILTKMFASVLKSMRRENVGRLILLGKATRDILYKNPRFDLRSLIMVATMPNQSDYTVFATVSKKIEQRGITILPQHLYLKDYFLAPGRYGRKASSGQIKDVVFGMVHCVKINEMDIGQTVVVGDGAVLAVEGAEGTDLCIRRGGELFRGRGAVVCKVAKRAHDERFDMPVTGMSTLESMSASGCRLLAIEAARTLVLDPPEFLREAAARSITVLALDPEQATEAALRRLNRHAGRVN